MTIETSSTQSSRAEVAIAFLKMGCISFGGPIAHVGYFHHEFVLKRRWLDETAFSDLVALCQFLPGPASSQLVFALGRRQAGLAGAFLASLCFTLPSALLMVAFAYGVATIDGLRHAAWLHGLKLAAVSIVAQAVWGMGRTLCPDRTRISLAVAAGAVLLLWPHAGTQVGVIVLGALAGWWFYRNVVTTTAGAPARSRRRHTGAAAALILCGALLLILPVLADLTGGTRLAVLDGFYRAGALVFGGGHVVLPLIRAEIVPPGWIDDNAFLAGYGAAQALPGPLFTFAAYLGTLIEGGPYAWSGGLLCLMAIMLPGWLLIGGALPFWDLLRSKTWMQAALHGANASVVGVLLAALYTPVWHESVSGPRDAAAVLAGFALLQVWRVPPWLFVLLASAAGHGLL